jgi:hypothetical protein
MKHNIRRFQIIVYYFERMLVQVLQPQQNHLHNNLSLFFREKRLFLNKDTQILSYPNIYPSFTILQHCDKRIIIDLDRLKLLNNISVVNALMRLRLPQHMLDVILLADLVPALIDVM